jgi:hypothetical protein
VNEQMVQAVIEDNMDLCCAYVEKLAIETAALEISEGLSSALTLRKKHRERSNQAFVDPSFVNSARYFSYAPEPLRPKPGGLSTHQVRIYDDFIRSGRMSSLATLPANIPALTNDDFERASMFLKSLNSSSGSESGVIDESNRNVLSTQQCLERFLVMRKKPSQSFWV